MGDSRLTQLLVSTYIVASDLKAGSPFLYDCGDDPSSRAAREQNGPVTWGVCRPDVRGQLAPGDWVAFFAGRKTGPLVDYFFVAALCVDRLTSHTEIWEQNDRLLQSYRNLLLRPCGEGWEHFEPETDRKFWHKDWMWRLCVRHGFRKKALVEAGDTHTPGDLLMVGGKPLPIANNYVVFSPDNQLVMEKPIKAAEFSKGQPAEQWLDDVRLRKLRRLVFGDTMRCLRTTNPQQPHRHVRRSLELPEDWIWELRSVVGPQ